MVGSDGRRLLARVGYEDTGEATVGGHGWGEHEVGRLDAVGVCWSSACRTVHGCVV